MVTLKIQEQYHGDPEITETASVLDINSKDALQES